MHPFRAAIEARDIDSAVDLLADDVVFRSPIVFRAYRGPRAVETVLRAVAGVLRDFRYEREVGAPGGREHVLVFRARVGDLEIEGCDILHTDHSGAIDEFVVMIRPLSGTLALAAAMKAQLAAAPTS